MKTFEIWDYNDNEKCALARKVEDIVNVCGYAPEHLRNIEPLFENPMKMFKFFVACIAYWSEAEYWDGRNVYAVFASKKINEFAKFSDLAEDYDDDTLINAYAFTHCAHRYLQCEFFKTIYEYFKEKNDSLYIWFEQNEFVFNNDHTELVPYKSLTRW